MLQTKTNFLNSHPTGGQKRIHYHSASVDFNKSGNPLASLIRPTENNMIPVKAFNQNGHPSQNNSQHKIIEAMNANKFSIQAPKSLQNPNSTSREIKILTHGNQLLGPKSISVTPDRLLKTPGLGRPNIGRFDPVTLSSAKFQTGNNPEGHDFRQSNNSTPTLQPVKSLPEGAFNKGLREKSENVNIHPRVLNPISSNTKLNMPLSTDDERREESKKKSNLDVKLPKIETNEKQQDLRKTREGFEQKHNVNNININLSINNLNIIQPGTENNEIKKPSHRLKAKSVDRNDQTNQKVDSSTSHLFQAPNRFTRNLSKDALTNFQRVPPTDLQDTPQQAQQEETRLRTSSGKKPMKSQRSTLPFEQFQEVKIVYNFSFKSKAGSLPHKPIKTNQDVYIIYPNLAGHKDKYFFGVCDGHGVNGHLVSNFVKQHLPSKLDYQNIIGLGNVETQYKFSPSEDISQVKNILTSGFALTNKEVIESPIDTNFSGTTIVTCLIFGTHLWCANVGDSRAVLGRYRSGEWQAVPVSRDHKPDDPQEMQRILSSGGRIEPFKDMHGDPIGPYRVWLKHENIPGLAMARSVGDRVAASVGVSSEPGIIYISYNRLEILDFELTEEDRILIIASDGVWEFLSNQQIVAMIAPFYLKNQLEAACDKVIKEATTRWKQVEKSYHVLKYLGR